MATPSQGRPISFSAPPITEVDVAAVVEVLRSGWITTGTECEKFEAELATHLDVEFVVACSSATTAQEIILAYLDLPAGSRIGVPDWTFASTALAVHRAGLVPVLLDVSADDLNLCPDSLSAAMAEGLDGVVGVHFGGVPFSAEIHRLCREAGIPLIEDAAHAFGARDHRGYVAGKQTAGAFFSFYATKNLPTGEGGAISTDDPDLAAFARTYRLHGMSADAINRYRQPGRHRYDVVHPGIKANLSDLQAALGRSQLSRFSERQDFRRLLMYQYRTELDGLDLRFVPSEAGDGSADHLCVIDLLDEDRCARVIKHLTEKNIGTSIHFRPLHTFDWFRRSGVPVGPSGLPVTRSMDGRVMSLPLHPGLTAADVSYVCEHVRLAC